MKNLLTALLLSILSISCATTLPPAGPTSKVIEGADKILIHIDQSPDEAYRDFAQYLSDKGFGFSNTDETLRVIKTDSKSSDKLNFTYSLNVSIRDTVIQLSGQGKNPMLGGFEIRNRGASGSLVGVAWSEMHELAKSYPNTGLSYKRN